MVEKENLQQNPLEHEDITMKFSINSSTSDVTELYEHLLAMNNICTVTLERCNIKFKHAYSINENGYLYIKPMFHNGGMSDSTWERIYFPLDVNGKRIKGFVNHGNGLFNGNDYIELLDMGELIIDDFGGNGMFASLTSLRELRLPDSMKLINDESFMNCDQLDSINMPKYLDEIGSFAFHGCDELRYITIPRSVRKIHRGAFMESGLHSISLPNISVIDVATFCSCKSLQQIIIPETVTKIGTEAFRNCISLTNMVIPNSVLSIGESAFHGCVSLREITIPNSVTTIGKDWLRGCNKLEVIYKLGDHFSTSVMNDLPESVITKIRYE